MSKLRRIKNIAKWAQKVWSKVMDTVSSVKKNIQANEIKNLENKLTKQTNNLRNVYQSNTAKDINELSKIWANKFENEFQSELKKWIDYNDKVPAYMQKKSELAQPQMPSRWFPVFNNVVSDVTEWTMKWTKWDNINYALDYMDNARRQASNLDYVEKANALWERANQSLFNTSKVFGDALNWKATKDAAKNASKLEAQAFDEYRDFLKEHWWAQPFSY